MRFATEVPVFADSLKSAENYPDGIIERKDGLPAVFVFPNKIDLGLASCRDAVIDAVNSGIGQNATIYSPTDGNSAVVDLRNRSTLTVNLTHDSLKAAYNALDIGLRDVVLPKLKCNFDLAKQPFRITTRQHLVYRAGDHFDTPNPSRRGHADDSIFVGGKWVRNDIRRHIVGLLWLQDSTERAITPDKENTHFQGGDLLFPLIYDKDDKPLRVKPTFGTLCFFPASPMYIHLVSKITAGMRISITTWYHFPEYH